MTYNKKTTTDIEDMIKDITLISKVYTGNTQKLQFKCNKHNHLFERTYIQLRTNRTCPICEGGNSKYIGEHIKFWIKENTDFILLNEPIKSTSKLQLKCPKHPNDIFTTNITHLKSGTRCFKCYNESRKIGLVESKLQVLDKSDVILIDTEYYGADQKHKFKCKEGHIFKSLLSNVKAGHGCPICMNLQSKGEIELIDFIKDNLDTDIIERSRDVINPYELDIYLPEFKLAIEYNGLYWHCELNKDNKSHITKREMCESHDIQLIQIWESEWLNNKELVKSMILAKLGLFKNRIYARKTDIKSVNSGDASLFLKRNHLMGNFKSAKHLGLYVGNKLVSMISYKKHKSGLDISRFCSERNTQVIGGLSKLLKEVERLNPNTEYIQYFVDLRYGGYGISSLGFKLENITQGFWWTDLKRIYNRLHCTATKGFTQKENANRLKLYKIYDAGQAKFLKN